MSLFRPPVLAEQPIPERRSALFAPFRFHDFRLLWFGLLVSNIGTWMQYTTLGYVVVKLAGDARLAALDVGILGACSAIPAVLCSPLGGYAADRFPRRRILFVTNGLEVAFALALALLASAHHLVLWEIFAIAALRSVGNSFDSPARQSYVPLLVPREYVGNAIGLNSVAFNTPSVIGPPVAGLLILSVGIAAAFYINAVATLAVVLALAFMRPVPASSSGREGVFRAIREGIAYIAADPVLRAVVTLLVCTCLFARSYSQLMPAYAAHVVHVDARGLGALLSAVGIGAIFGSLLTALIGERRRGGIWFASAVVLALGVVALGAIHSFALALAVLVAIGLAVLSFVGSSNVLMQTLSPDDMRGRVISVFTMIVLGLVPTGTLLIGSLASVIGLERAYLVGGSLSAVVAVTVWLSTPELRTV
ncbi:MAG: MFS transporter [Vulcanimicrobiaceae bacterium]